MQSIDCVFCVHSIGTILHSPLCKCCHVWEQCSLLFHQQCKRHYHWTTVWAKACPGWYHSNQRLGGHGVWLWGSTRTSGENTNIGSIPHF